MEKWTNIRDHKEFFLTITEAKESATALFDRCKNINTFVNDQFEGYQKVKLFIQENRDNFAFLPKGQEEAQNRLCAIHNDMEPWDNMPAYLKMMRNLGGRLEECKTTLIETINTNYNKAFDELEDYAVRMKVGRDKFAKRDITISQKINTANFYALQANAVIADFYEEQMKKINEAVPKPVDPKPYTSVADGGGSVVKEPIATPRARKMVHLHTESCLKPTKTGSGISTALGTYGFRTFPSSGHHRAMRDSQGGSYSAYNIVEKFNSHANGQSLFHAGHHKAVEAAWQGAHRKPTQAS